MDKQAEDVMLQVYNMQGLLVRNIKTTAVNSIHINVADLPSGLYILKATSGKEIGNKKFTVRH
jgi:hypothetical protein